MSTPVTPASTVFSLSITREMPVSRQSLYTTWIDLDLAPLWWGPEGCHSTAMICEAVPGGRFRWELTTAGGESMTALGEFQEVVDGEKFIYTWRWLEDPLWDGHQSVITVLFRDQGPRASELQLLHEHFPSEESRDNHIGGWTHALDKLERLLAHDPEP